MLTTHVEDPEGLNYEWLGQLPLLPVGHVLHLFGRPVRVKSSHVSLDRGTGVMADHMTATQFVEVVTYTA